MPAIKYEHNFWNNFHNRKHQGKGTQNLSHISPLYTYHTNTYFAHPIGHFCLPIFLQNLNKLIMCDFSLVWHLVLSRFPVLFFFFYQINNQEKNWAMFYLESVLLLFNYTYTTFSHLFVCFFVLFLFLFFVNPELWVTVCE